jgi:hypothetical protein
MDTDKNILSGCGYTAPCLFGAWVDNLCDNKYKGVVEMKRISKKRLSQKNKSKKSEFRFLGDIIPNYWEKIKLEMPKNDGAASLAAKIPELLKHEDYIGEINESLAHSLWNTIGYYYRKKGRWNDALNIYLAEYIETMKAQMILERQIHKGTALCWASDVFTVFGCPVLAKRFIMLTLCEDAIANCGIVLPADTGVYFRLKWKIYR